MAPAMRTQSYSYWIVYFLMFLILSPAEVIAGYPRLTVRQTSNPSSFSTTEDTSEDVSTRTSDPSETFTSTATLTSLSTSTVYARCTLYVDASVTLGYWCDLRPTVSSTRTRPGNAPKVTTVVETVTVTGPAPNSTARPSPSQVSILSTFETVTSSRSGNYSRLIVPSTLSTLNATSSKPWSSQVSSEILGTISMNDPNSFISAPSTSGAFFNSGSSQTPALPLNISQAVMPVPSLPTNTKTASWPVSVAAFNSTSPVTSPVTRASVLNASRSSPTSASASSMLKPTDTTSKPSFVNTTSSVSAMNTSLSIISTATATLSSFSVNNTATSTLRSASNASTPLSNLSTTSGPTYSANPSASTGTPISGSSATTVSESPIPTVVAQDSYPGPDDTWRDPYLDSMIQNATVCKVYPGDEPDPNCPIGDCKPTKADPCVIFAQIWDDPVVRHMIAPPATKTQTSSAGLPTGSSYISATTTSAAVVPQESGNNNDCDEKCTIGLGVGLGVGIPAALLAVGAVKGSVGFGFFRAASSGEWFNFGRILKGFTKEVSKATEAVDPGQQLQELKEACNLVDWSLTAARGASMVTLPPLPPTLPPIDWPPNPAGDEEVYEDEMDSASPEAPDPPAPPAPPREWDGSINLGGTNPADPPTFENRYYIEESSDLYRELSKPVQSRFQRTRAEEEAEADALIQYVQEGHVFSRDEAAFVDAVNRQFHENHVRDAEYWRETDPSRSGPNPSVYLTSFLNEVAVPRPNPPTQMVNNYLRAATDAVKGIPNTELRELEFKNLRDKVSEKIGNDVKAYIEQAGPTNSVERITRRKEVMPWLEQLQENLLDFHYSFHYTYPDGLIKYPAKYEWVGGEWVTQTSEG